MEDGLEREGGGVEWRVERHMSRLEIRSLRKPGRQPERQRR